MEILSPRWFSEMEMGIEDSTFDYLYHMNPIDQEINFQSFSSNSYPINDQIIFNHQNPQKFTYSSFGTPQIGMDERPAKQQKTNSWNSYTTKQIPSQSSPSSSSYTISFDLKSHSPPATSSQFYGLSSSVVPKNEVGSDGNTDDEYGTATYYEQRAQTFGAVSRSPLQAQDHVIAERKRREKLSQRFIALSAAVPGLKKKDKASILEDTIKYLKYLQERMKTLEEEAAKKTIESIVYVKKSQILVDDDSSSIEENSDGCCDHPLPEIETRVSDKDVLIRIHCEKQKGCLVKILNEMEKFHLNVVNSKVLSFGNSTFDVSLVAQMDADFSMKSMKDLVRKLRQALIMDKNKC